MPTPSASVAAACLLSLLLAGCHAESASKVSDDLAALNQLVVLNLPASSAKWEIFGTPEYTGGVPGPTDYITLVAQLEATDGKVMPAAAPDKKVWIAPESARPWLDQPFRAFLERNKNQTIDVTSAPDCRNWRTRVKKSDTPVDGLLCRRNGKVLLYLTIADHAAT